MKAYSNYRESTEKGYLRSSLEVLHGSSVKIRGLRK
jgi:hypothetical protein